MIKNYFKIAWRNLLKQKRITAINVFGLSIGMGAAILIALWVQNELSFDNYHPAVNDIYLIRAVYSSGDKTITNEYTQYILGETAAKDIPEADAVTRIGARSVYLHYKGDIITEQKAAFVDDKWFDVFHYNVVDGSVSAFKTNPFSLILTETTAKRYFGQQEAVGKLMRIDSNLYQVQAVIKDNPANSTFQYNVLIPVAAQLTLAATRKRYLSWSNCNYVTFIKLKQNTDVHKVEAKLKNIYARNAKIAGSAVSYNLLPVKKLHFENDVFISAFQHGSRTMVSIFVILGSLILIMACINYVNLTTARASIRSREVGIRKIIGAGRMYLFGQFMSESLLISFLSVLVSLVLVQLCMPWYRNFTGENFADPVSSPLIWSIVGCTLLVSFVLNGIYPALLLSSFKPLNVFRGNALLKLRDSGLRKSLVVLQFTVSVILIIGAFVIYRQLKYAENMDLGYDKEQVLVVELPFSAFKNVSEKEMPAKLDMVKQEFKSQSAVADVALSNGEVVDIGNSSSLDNFNWNSKPKIADMQVMRFEADPDFQRTLHLKMKEGRWFDRSGSDEHNVILNETAVDEFSLNKKSLIGMRFIHNGDTGVIVGVVKDFHYTSMHDKIEPMVISDSQEDCFTINVRIHPHNTRQAIDDAKEIVSKLAPGEPFNYSFLDDDYNKLYRSEQSSSVLISLFAVIAIVISALGLLGLATFSAQQRIKEIGIRKVFGASIKDIIQLLSSNFIKITLLACLIAFPVGWWTMDKWLQSFAYRIHLSWWLFGMAGAIALAMVLLTVGSQAFKAARANPVNSLRNE